jgi:hypothetical protein
MPRHQVSLKTLLWLTAVVAAFFTGWSVRDELARREMAALSRLAAEAAERERH